jgi:hypothetical protein
MTTARTMPNNSETIVPTDVDMNRWPRRTQTALKPQETAAVSAKTTARASELTEAQDGRFAREEQPKLRARQARDPTRAKRDPQAQIPSVVRMTQVMAGMNRTA